MEEENQWVELESTPGSQVVHTLEYGPLNQPIKGQIVPERYNKLCYDINKYILYAIFTDNEVLYNVYSSTPLLAVIDITILFR